MNVHYVHTGNITDDAYAFTLQKEQSTISKQIAKKTCAQKMHAYTTQNLHFLT